MVAECVLPLRIASAGPIQLLLCCKGAESSLCKIPWVDCVHKDTSDGNLQTVLFYSSFTLYFRINLFALVGTSLEMHILTPREHASVVDFAFHLHSSLREFSSCSYLCNAPGAFSPCNSKTTTLVFLCLVAGMVCCCYCSFEQAELANKVTPAQAITSLCWWLHFLSQSHCPCNTQSRRDHCHISVGSIHNLCEAVAQRVAQHRHTFLFADTDGKGK